MQAAADGPTAGGNVLAFSIPVNPLTDIRKKYNSVPI
jgi:hypothetical protein